MAGEQALSKVLELQGLMSEGSEGLVHVAIELRGGVGAGFDSSYCTASVWHSGEIQLFMRSRFGGQCVVSASV